MTKQAIRDTRKIVLLENWQKQDKRKARLRKWKSSRRIY